MSNDICDIILITINIFVLNFCDLAAWACCWSLVSISRFISKFSNVFPFDYTAVAEGLNVGPFKLRLTTPIG